MGIKSLFPLHRAPDLDSVLHEPFNHKGRFVLLAAEAVKHEHQQNVKFALSRIPLDVLDRITVLCRNFEAGDAFFRKLLCNLPSVGLGKFMALLLLHRDIIFFDLSLC